MAFSVSFAFTKELSFIGLSLRGTINRLTLQELAKLLAFENTYAEEAVLNTEGKIDYSKFKPVLLQMPTYEYIRTGDVVVKCMKIGRESLRCTAMFSNKDLRSLIIPLFLEQLLMAWMLWRLG